MKPLTQFSAKKIRAVFTDIDDTLTTNGLLTASAFDAIWRLREKKVAVIAVTGRPAGWCDHIARMWPVAGVIGENGAFFFRYDHEQRRFLRRFLIESQEERDALQKHLKKVERRILTAVPKAAVASDQAYRIHDLAIDYCEDVQPLSEAEIDRIVSVFEKAGATAKVSSIHVNGWFGSWNKLDMIRIFAREVLSLDLDKPTHNAQCVYVGDSPNDEPAFEFFKNAIGVANIRNFADRLKHPPTYVTRKEGGDGFAEAARKILKPR